MKLFAKMIQNRTMLLDTDITAQPVNEYLADEFSFSVSFNDSCYKCEVILLFSVISFISMSRTLEAAI